MKVRKLIVFDGKMGMRKFWSVALPFSKVVYAVKVYYKLNNITYKDYYPLSLLRPYRLN